MWAAASRTTAAGSSGGALWRRSHRGRAAQSAALRIARGFQRWQLRVDADAASPEGVSPWCGRDCCFGAGRLLITNDLASSTGRPGSQERHVSDPRSAQGGHSCDHDDERMGQGESGSETCLIAVGIAQSRGGRAVGTDPDRVLARAFPGRECRGR